MTFVFGKIMKTLKIHSEIGTDGMLRLEVPTDLDPGPAEVTVVVQPEVFSGTPTNTRSGLFVGKSSESINPDVAIGELNTQWQAKLEDLH